MRSIVIYHKITRKLLTCIWEPAGTTFTKEAICAGMGVNPDDYAEQFIAGKVNRYTFIDTRYIDENEVIRDRPKMSPQTDKEVVAADGVDVVTISGLPTPCVAEIGEQTVTVEDGVLELTFDTPGDYLVKLSAHPYVNGEVTVYAR